MTTQKYVDEEFLDFCKAADMNDDGSSNAALFTNVFKSALTLLLKKHFADEPTNRIDAMYRYFLR